ncbi:hypothetical protein MRX96_054698 [Rhipicephalus microplus]
MNGTSGLGSRHDSSCFSTVDYMLQEITLRRSRTPSLKYAPIDHRENSAPAAVWCLNPWSMVTVKVPVEEKTYGPGEKLGEAGRKRSKIRWDARRSWPQWCRRCLDALFQHNIPVGHL